MDTPKTPKNYTANAAAMASARPVELAVPGACAGLRLDQALARLLPAFSRSRLAQWVRAERVLVDGRPVPARHRLHGGENVRVSPAADPGELAWRPQDIPLEIVHEDEALLVVNKPPGLVVHPGSGNWQGTLLNALLAHAPQLAQLPRAGIVHRLDKDTSGLLVVARTLAAHTDLVRQMQARRIARVYLAAVHGRVARDGLVDAPVGRHPVHRTRMAVVASGKPAVTHYSVAERYAHATLLRCRLETGRTHQIRVHLDSIGHPLIGDPVYGGRKSRSARGVPPFPRQALHAEELALRHPVTGRPAAWRAPLPADLRGLIAQLRGAA
jgi:23S rRNA pseudouridine1911/1915/1917 synthase